MDSTQSLDFTLCPYAFYGGNSLYVRGREESVLIDPSLGVVARGAEALGVDRILNSHCHEDHTAGNSLFSDAACHLHERDLPGIRSLDAMLEIFGYPEPVYSGWKQALVERFHFSPRPDALPYQDGDVFDLGGGVRIRTIHAPGHTRGHCLLHIEPDDVLFLGDIDLSSFGPYYGDAWSSLDEFIPTLAKVRTLRARHYATFHHVGVIDHDTFLARLDRFEAKIPEREQRLLAYLAEPRDLDEIAEHRFIYRPEDPVPFATPVERWSMQQHVERLLREGRVHEVEPGRYQAGTP